MTSKEQCCDDRFEIINETKQYIINATNIETSPEEMNVLDSICFRLWQLGLTKRNKDKLKELTRQPTLSDCIKEWEDNGCFVTKSNKELIIESCEHLRDLDITICKANLIYEISNYYEDKPACISPELHHLLSKTLKALEEMKDE